MDIKGLRLISGEEIVGNVKIQDRSYTIEEPCALQYGATQDSARAQMSFRPLLPHSKSSSVTIDKTHVLFDYEPVEEIRNKWNELFGNGLVVPDSGVKTLS